MWGIKGCLSKQAAADPEITGTEAKPHAPLCDGMVFCEPVELEAVPCDICKMLLNGPRQYQCHLKGKRHRNTVRKQRVARSEQPGPPSGWAAA